MVTQFDLDCERKSVLTLVMSIFFVGMGFGAIVSGSIVDRYGRKITLIPALATIFILGFASPFVNNVFTIVVFRFFIGFAFPALLIYQSVLTTEFVGGSVRHIAVSTNMCVFCLSWVVLGVKAYFVHNWKYLSILCTAPYAFIVLFYFFIPESARWLHVKGRNDEALLVLRKIARCNKRSFPDDVTLPTKLLSNQQPSGRNINLLHLFKTPKLVIRTVVTMLLWIGSSMQIYGLQFAASDLG